MKILIRVLLLVSVVSLLVQCKTEESLVVPLTELELTLTDEGEFVDSVSVYLFETEDGYQKAVDSFGEDVDAASKKAISLNGQVLLSDLRSDVSYYVYAVKRVYKDTSTFKENYYHLTNQLHRFESSFRQKSLVQAKIELEKADGVLVLYTKNNEPALPANVLVDEKNKGAVSEVVITQDVDYPKAFIARLPVGEHKYLVQSTTTSCEWGNDVVIRGGQNLLIDIGQCDNGVAKFWTSDINSTYLPIAIYSNSDRHLGDLTTTSTTQPDCEDNTSQVIGFLKDTETSYYAVSADGKFRWQGDLDLAGNDCVQIRLEDAP